MRWLPIVLLLAGCDQLLHRSFGELIACDVVRHGAEPEAAVDHALAFAARREDLQHPGRCGKGCREDLENWRIGAERGARCI